MSAPRAHRRPSAARAPARPWPRLPKSRKSPRIFAARCRYAPDCDIVWCGAEPAGKKRLGFIADRAAVVEEFDHFDASALGDRALGFDALEFTSELDLGRCSPGEQRERRREKPFLHAPSQFHSLERKRRHARVLLLRVACGFLR